MNNIRIVPMTADHLDALEQLERTCFSRPYPGRCWPRSWTTNAPPF